MSSTQTFSFRGWIATRGPQFDMWNDETLTYTGQHCGELWRTILNAQNFLKLSEDRIQVKPKSASSNRPVLHTKINDDWIPVQIIPVFNPIEYSKSEEEIAEKEKGIPQCGKREKD